MDFTGEYRIPAPRQKVWEALNDPEQLKAAIPGCQEIEKRSDTELTAKVRAKVGPVAATFTGDVALENLNPPESYRLRGSGKGGAAGFAKGYADVDLKEEGPASTVLTYRAQADVGGKLAQLGSRLIQGTAKKYADDFFGNLSRQVGGAEQPAVAPETAERPAAPMEPAPDGTIASTGPRPAAAHAGGTSTTPTTVSEGGGNKLLLWGGVAAAVVVVLVLLLALG